jgi:hypothetical protein
VYGTITVADGIREREKYVNLRCVQFKPSSGRENKIEGKLKPKAASSTLGLGKGSESSRSFLYIAPTYCYTLNRQSTAQHSKVVRTMYLTLQMGQGETPKSNAQRDRLSGKKKERTESVTPSPAKTTSPCVWMRIGEINRDQI